MVKKNFESLNELIRIIDNNLHYMSYKDYLEKLKDIKYRNNFFNKNSNCCLKLKCNNKLIVFPICNQSANFDSKIIKFSIKFANVLKDKPYVDNNELTYIIKKLEFLLNKYSKKIPKPNGRPAYLKGRNTTFLNNISKKVKEINNL